jgi:hypothetical protein
MQLGRFVPYGEMCMMARTYEERRETGDVSCTPRVKEIILFFAVKIVTNRSIIGSRQWFSSRASEFYSGETLFEPRLVYFFF